jgi:hypothetical protein
MPNDILDEIWRDFERHAIEYFYEYPSMPIVRKSTTESIYQILRVLSVRNIGKSRQVEVLNAVEASILEEAPATGQYIEVDFERAPSDLTEDIIASTYPGSEVECNFELPAQACVGKKHTIGSPRGEFHYRMRSLLQNTEYSWAVSYKLTIDGEEVIIPNCGIFRVQPYLEEHQITPQINTFMDFNDAKIEDRVVQERSKALRAKKASLKDKLALASKIEVKFDRI